MKTAAIRLKKVLSVINKAGSDISEKRIAAYAAQASFFVIISSVPFVMLLLSFIQSFMTIDKQEILNFVNQFVPNEIFNFVNNVINEMYTKVNISVISITALTLLWSASRGVKSIGQGLDNVYCSKRSNGYIKNSLIYLFYTIIFMIIMIGCVAVLVFGKYLSDVLVERVPSTKVFIESVMILKSVIFLVFLTSIFMLGYHSLAKSNLSFKQQLPGAFLAAIGWLIFSFGYSLYIENFTDYSYIYGSLTAIILLMLWLFMCMQILLIGALINVWIFNNDRVSNKMYKKICVKKKCKEKIN